MGRLFERLLSDRHLPQEDGTERHSRPRFTRIAVVLRQQILAGRQSASSDRSMSRKTKRQQQPAETSDAYMSLLFPLNFTLKEFIRIY